MEFSSMILPDGNDFQTEERRIKTESVATCRKQARRRKKNRNRNRTTDTDVQTQTQRKDGLVGLVGPDHDEGGAKQGKAMAHFFLPFVVFSLGLIYLSH